MIFKSYVAALEEYSRLVTEYQTAREAYDIETSKENWDSRQEAIKKLKRQDGVIKLNRWLFEKEKKYTDNVNKY